jgi:hypothetical protein
MNMEIGTEAAQFPEKEYIKGIFVAVPTTDVFMMHYSQYKNEKYRSCLILQSDHILWSRTSHKGSAAVFTGYFLAMVYSVQT